MSSIGVVYATKTNHSRQYAEAIAKALGVKANNVASQPTLEGVEFLFVVGGTYGKQSLPELIDYMKGPAVDHVKKAALVSSSASMRIKQDEVRDILEGKGVAVVDEVICPGNFLFLRKGHPNDADFHDVVAFAVKVSESAV